MSLCAKCILLHLASPDFLALLNKHGASNLTTILKYWDYKLISVFAPAEIWAVWEFYWAWVYIYIFLGSSVYFFLREILFRIPTGIGSNVLGLAIVCHDPLVRICLVESSKSSCLHLCCTTNKINLMAIESVGLIWQKPSLLKLTSTSCWIEIENLVIVFGAISLVMHSLFASLLSDLIIRWSC